MASRSYWLDLFTGTTWREFKAHGAKVSGFRESRWKTVQKIRPGDYLLCYLTGLSRFIGALEVVSEPFRDEAPIWADESFPCRLRVKLVIELTPETGVPVHSLKEVLSVFQDLTSPMAWTGHFRGSPTRWKQSDGEAVVTALQDAESNPVERPFDKRKLERRPRALQASIGAVTIPDEVHGAQEIAEVETPKEHGEIQALLLRLGADMGFDVWVARNDRGRRVGEAKLGDLPRARPELPRQFDEATNRTIELIDVLWLRGNAIVAAFEVESTTSIYSGLLRMSDLVALQPNLNIPLYLVAPDARRDKVFAEVNRPTFSRLRPSLAEICRYISFDVLREQLQRVAPVVQYLKPEFLEELSESCALEDG